MVEARSVQAHRTKGVTGSDVQEGAYGVGGGNGDGNGVGGGNGDVNGHGGGDGTRVEVNEGAQDGNGDGNGEGSEYSGGDGNGDEDNGNGNGNQDKIGEGGREEAQETAK